MNAAGLDRQGVLSRQIPELPSRPIEDRWKGRVRRAGSAGDPEFQLESKELKRQIESGEIFLRASVPSRSTLTDSAPDSGPLWELMHTEEIDRFFDAHPGLAHLAARVADLLPMLKSLSECHPVEVESVGDELNTVTSLIADGEIAISFQTIESTKYGRRFIYIRKVESRAEYEARIGRRGH